MKRLLLALGPFLFFMVGLLSFAVLLFRTSIVNSENNHYLRVLTCLGSIPTELKTEANVDRCWRAVEQADGILAPRYDRVIIPGQPEL